MEHLRVPFANIGQFDVGRLLPLLFIVLIVRQWSGYSFLGLLHDTRGLW
jgi:hypothetical protein